MTSPNCFHPGPPRKCAISFDFAGFPGYPGRTWVLFSAILQVFRDFLGEPGCYFLRFCRFSGISWENLGVIFCDFAGFPGFPGRTWVLFSMILWGFRDRTWVLFSAILWSFRDFFGEPGWKRLRNSCARAWENLGGLRRTWADLDGVSLNKQRVCKPQQSSRTCIAMHRRVRR